MSKHYTVRKGLRIGRSHIIDSINRQDALSLFDGQINGERVITGIICDGCSEGTASEVGANLASTFLTREIPRLIGVKIPTEIIPTYLYVSLLDFLGGITNLYPFGSAGDRISFIKNNLLFTVVGFILTEETTVVFTAGDGTIVINQAINHIDADNRPTYPAYHLVDRSVLEQTASELPDSFDIQVYPTDSLQRLAIGSDAWKDEPDLLDQIWNTTQPAAIQRRLNQWSNKDHRFRDDVSIITVEIGYSSEGE